MTFASTKIQAPRPRAAVVERGELQAQLAEALSAQRLVLLAAPAGYGKTSALAELARADWRGRPATEAQATLAAWSAALAAPVADAPAQPAGAAVAGERLTAREVEVLARIAAGDSNKLIARAFDLSLHTVKRHVANILGKVDADSRGRAAAWYLAQKR